MVKVELAKRDRGWYHYHYISSVILTTVLYRRIQDHMYELALCYMQAKQNCCTWRKQNWRSKYVPVSLSSRGVQKETFEWENE